MRKILLFFLVFVCLSLFFAKESKAACYCVDPDRCVCADPPPADATHSAEFAGIQLRCTDPRDPNSVFSVKDPVCDGRFNNEIPPSCAYVQGQDWQIVCWGTGFVYEPLTIPPNTGGGPINWYPHNPATPNSGSPPVVFNGFSSDTNANNLNDETPAGGPGITLLHTCHEDVFCCTRSDCVGGDPSHEITQGCGSRPGELGKIQPVDPDVLPLCFGVPGSQIPREGESRLWFSQARLVATLSTLAQTMFAPFSLDNRYQETAMSKNAPVSDPSGRIDNVGALTSRTERHQGIHDNVQVVNQTDNNSSVIEGFPAPPALFSFNDDRESFPYDDARACYIPDAVENPGDDLIGPRIKGELLFTEEFAYTPLPNTSCSDVGATVADETECCSQQAEASFSCYQKDPVEACPLGTYQTACGGTPHCCPGAATCSTSVSVCTNPEQVSMQVEGFTEVFSKTPLIEYINKTILDGRDSLYKTFFPISFWTNDDGTDKPFDEIPAKSNFRAEVTAGNVDSVTYAEGQADSPEIYFPHLGTLDKYWMYDFQKGLRPKGFERGATIITPPGNGGAPMCDLGFGPCEVASLTPFFEARGGSCGVNEATVASQLCQRESNSGPFARNISCLTAPTGGFAIGLFQINLAPVPQYHPVTGSFMGVRDIGRCDPGTFLLDATTREEARYCRIANPGSADCSDLIPGLTECNQPLRDCIEKYFDAEENRRWAALRACNGQSGDCQCDWSPWYFDPTQYPGACNPIP